MTLSGLKENHERCASALGRLNRALFLRLRLGVLVRLRMAALRRPSFEVLG